MAYDYKFITVNFIFFNIVCHFDQNECNKIYNLDYVRLMKLIVEIALVTFFKYFYTMYSALPWLAHHWDILNAMHDTCDKI